MVPSRELLSPVSSELAERILSGLSRFAQSTEYQFSNGFVTPIRHHIHQQDDYYDSSQICSEV